MLLARENRASRPPKPCHHQSQRHTRSVMPLAKKTASAPPARTNARKARRLGLNGFMSGSLYSFRPNHLACKRAARPEYRPCCLKSTATRTKNHPPWDGLKICQFAFLRQGPFASAEYLVQLTSSLAQKVCLARGSPCPPGEWLKSHIAQPAEKGASS